MDEKVSLFSLQGLVFKPTASQLKSYRQLFTTHRYLQIPNFLDSKSVATLRKILNKSKVVERKLSQNEYGQIGSELASVDPQLHGLIHFFLNNASLLKLIESITNKSVGHFAGRTYKMLADSDHGLHWHDDLRKGRQVAMSLNLSNRYSGGHLELRRKGTKKLLADIHNARPGSLLIFEVNKNLEHRLTPITGKYPKIAVAGWFKNGRDFDIGKAFHDFGDSY